jgi:ribosomal protein S18 acetylase RimI-like enzyme
MAAYGPWEEYIRQYRRQLFGITSVQVAPRWRGKGLGKLILIRALEAAVEAGAEAAHLHVWRENKVAWDLYHRAVGFRPKHTWVTLVKDCSAGFSLQGPL